MAKERILNLDGDRFSPDLRLAVMRCWAGLRIQIVMAGRKRSSGRNAPSGVDTVVHELNSNHKETISLVLD
ncbi:hypothetical protein YC2023_101207 [Brassica napus]